MSESYHETAQVCKNGHVITTLLEMAPSQGEKFCSRCGEETICACQKCGSKIRGEYIVPGVLSMGSHYRLPSYCYSCGKPYLWTEEKIKAIQDFSAEVIELTSDDVKVINDNVTDLVVDSPKAQVSAIRIKKVLSKVGGAFINKLQDMIVDIASETAVKLIKG